MAYTAKNYDHLKGGALKGFSDSQLDQHFTLYKGYVTKLNEIEEKLADRGQHQAQLFLQRVQRTEAARGRGLQRLLPARALLREPGRRQRISADC